MWRYARALVVVTAGLVVGGLVPAATSAAQEAPEWTLSLTVTKVIVPDVSQLPSLDFLLEQRWSITATCTAVGTADATAPDAAANGGGIVLAAAGSDDSATVAIRAGEEATIPVTVTDATGVEHVSCSFTEAPVTLPEGHGVLFVQPQLPDDVQLTPAHPSATVRAENLLIGPDPVQPLNPPPPVTTEPVFTG